MTYATSAQLSASERFFLVKIEPRKYLGLGTHVTGNTYTFSTTLPRVDAVHLDGSTSGITSFSLSNGVLTVVSPSNLASASFTVTADFYQFYTGSKVRDTAGNTAGLPEEIWEPYITNYPQFSQSMRSIADGVFSIANTQLDLISENRLLHGYFGDDYSWANAPVTVWSCIDEVNTCRLVFTGNVASANLTSSSVSLSVLDSFQKLTKSATFGDYESTHVFNGSTLAEYPDADDQNAAAPIVIGKSSPYTLGYGHHPSPVGDPITKHYHVKDGLKLIKDSHDTYQEGDTVTFFVGRFIGTDLKKMTFGTVTRCYREYSYNTTDTGGMAVFAEVYHIQCSNFTNGEIGDCLPDGLPGVNGAAAWISNNQAYTGPDSQTYQFTAVIPRGTFVTSSRSSNGLTSNPTLVDNSYYSFSVFRSNVNSITYEIEPSDVTTHDMFYYINHFNGDAVTPVVTSLGTLNGQNISALHIQIDYSLTGVLLFFNLNDVTHQSLRCRFSPNESVTHAEAMKFIVDSAGMTSNSASFTQADSDLSANVSMTLPASGNQFGTYLEAAQSITSSTLGVLRLNTDRDVEYQILDYPGSLTSSGTRDDVNMISGESTTSIQYQDMYSEVQFLNPQLQNVDAANGTGPRAVVENAITKHLHRVQRIKTHEHVLESIQNRKAAIAGYLSAANVEYQFSTASEDLVTSIGDVLSIDNATVANADGTADGLVVDVQSSGQKSTIVINELRGLQ